MLSRSGRPFAQALFGPVARAFIKLGISADAVTIFGTIVSCAVTVVVFFTDYLALGAWLITAAVIFDNLDGQIARATNSVSAWGGFLDSTGDRIVDGVLFGSIAWWALKFADPGLADPIALLSLATLIFGSVVPYARAKGESLGCDVSIGLAERADRLFVALLATFLTGLHLGDWIMLVALGYLTAASLVTIIQRAVTVHRQLAARGQAGARR